MQLTLNTPTVDFGNVDPLAQYSAARQADPSRITRDLCRARDDRLSRSRKRHRKRAKYGREVASPDCATAHVVLQLGSSGPVNLVLVTYRSGLPPEGAKLLKARPPQAVPSQGGDRIILAAKIERLPRAA